MWNIWILFELLKSLQEQFTILKSKFKMKDLRKQKKQKKILDLQIEYFSNKMLVYQLAYTKKVLKHFYMDKLHSLSSPTVVRSLKVNKDFFHLKEDNEELFGLKVPYLNAISALMYLTNCTDQIQHFLSTCQQDTILPQLESIRMRLNIYCDTFMKQVTQAYIIQKNQNYN